LDVVLDTPIESVRRNIRTRPLRWGLVLGAPWVISADISPYVLVRPALGT